MCLLWLRDKLFYILNAINNMIFPSFKMNRMRKLFCTNFLLHLYEIQHTNKYMNPEHLFFFYLVYKIPYIFLTWIYTLDTKNYFKTEQIRPFLQSKLKINRNWVTFKNNRIVPLTTASDSLCHILTGFIIFFSG